MALGGLGKRQASGSGGGGGTSTGNSMTQCPLITTLSFGFLIVIIMFYSPRDEDRVKNAPFNENPADRFLFVDEDQFIKCKALIVFLASACIVFGLFFLLTMGEWFRRPARSFGGATSGNNGWLAKNSGFIVPEMIL